MTCLTTAFQNTHSAISYRRTWIYYYKNKAAFNQMAHSNDPVVQYTPFIVKYTIRSWYYAADDHHYPALADFNDAFSFAEMHYDFPKAFCEHPIFKIIMTGACLRFIDCKVFTKMVYWRGFILLLKWMEYFKCYILCVRLTLFHSIF